MNVFPSFSIITVVYNDAAALGKTLENIVAQEYKRFELIIVDGGSTDGTVDVIKKYEQEHPKISLKWTTEPDRGIYDAMNKGTALAEQDYINFMNAGDGFVDTKVLSRVASVIGKAAGETTGTIDKTGANRENRALTDVLYGDTMVEYPDLGIEKPVKAKALRDMWKGMTFCHQSCFVRRNLLHSRAGKEAKEEARAGTSGPFDIGLHITADFDLLYRMYRRGRRFLYADMPVAKIEAGGVSDERRIQVLREQRQTLKKTEPKALRRGYYALAYGGFAAVQILRKTGKKILPDKKIKNIITKRK